MKRKDRARVWIGEGKSIDAKRLGPYQPNTPPVILTRPSTTAEIRARRRADEDFRRRAMELPAFLGRLETIGQALYELESLRHRSMKAGNATAAKLKRRAEERFRALDPRIRRMLKAGEKHVYIAALLAPEAQVSAESVRKYVSAVAAEMRKAGTLKK